MNGEWMVKDVYYEDGIPKIIQDPVNKQWEGLSSGDIEAAYYHVEFDKVFIFYKDPAKWCTAFARMIEKILREKNG